MITRAVNTRRVRATEKPFMVRQVRMYLAFLRQARLSAVRAQVYVQSMPHGVHTWVDVVCVERTPAGSRLALIENKTTQMRAADYMRVYREPCARQPVLSNGLPNTEYTRHQLQLGLAMLVAARFDLGAPPRGYVIVRCRDRLLRIPAAPWVLRPQIYPILSAAAS